MVCAIALAGLHLCALALYALEPSFGRAVFAFEQALLALAFLVWPPARRAMTAALGHYLPAVLAFMAAVAVTAWQAGLLGAPAIAFSPAGARSEVWNLAALLLAVAAAAGAAGAAGRRPAHNMVLIAGLIFTTFDAIGKLQYGADHPVLGAPGEAAAVYALFAVLAVFVLHDEATSPQQHATPAQLGKRLILPGVVLTATIMGFLLSRAPLVSAALVAGIGLTILMVSFRAMPRPVSFALGGVGLAALGAAALLTLGFANPADPFGLTGFEQSLDTAIKGPAGLGAGVEGGMLQTWPVEGGLYGAGAMGLAVLALLVRLALSPDRRRSPSRGLALAAAALATAGFAGEAGSSPAVAGTLAIIIGLSCSYADRLRQSARRTSRRNAELPLESGAMRAAA